MKYGRCRFSTPTPTMPSSNAKKILQFILTIALVAIAIVGGYTLYVNHPFQNSQNQAESSPVAASESHIGENRAGMVSTNNPIANYYPDSDYPWTNEICWDCIYNINDFSGSTLVARFNAARDAAANHGGGVVYFPAGTYEFEDGIQLKDSVVIRGETPDIRNAKSADYSPPTKFVFPQYEPRRSGSGTPNDTAFKLISTANPDRDSNIGIVDIDLNRAGIKLNGNIDNGKQRNIIVFGVRSNNVAQPDPNIPSDFQDGWVRYSYRFVANIDINTRENALIANNRVNDNITDNYPQPGYKVRSRNGKEIVTYRDGDKVPFHYGNHYGIVVNRSKAGGFQKAATPDTEPGLFRTGITVRDNWVYHTMRVAISASGEGLVVRDNEIRDNPDKQWWTDPTGLKQPSGAVTWENRGIDWSGWKATVDGNNYRVYRHQVMDTKYLSVDGEGILIQECCGGTTVKGAKITNNEGNAYIGIYKVPGVEDVLIQNNRITTSGSNIATIYVNADTNNSAHSMSDVRIEDNRISGSIFVQASAGGSGNVVRDNRGDNSGEISHSCHVRVENNRGFTQTACLQ